MTHKQPSVPAFGNRLAYLLWLRHLDSGECPGNAEIGRAVGVTGPAVTTWLKRENAPDQWKRSVERALIEFFGTDWFLEGQGEAPRAELWAVWMAARYPVNAVKASGIDRTRPADAKKRPRQA